MLIEEKILGEKVILETGEYYFSSKEIDKGTQALLSEITWRKEERVLDLGCGYGVVGIVAAQKVGENNVTMCDVLSEAVRLAKKNCERNQLQGVQVLQSNGFSNVKDTGYTLILSNPSYHSDFSVAKSFIEDGYKHLAFGGRMMMVTKRRTWYKNKFIAVFGGVTIIEKDEYYIFVAEKRRKLHRVKKKRRKMSKKLERKRRRCLGR